MFIPDMPNVPPQNVPVLIAQANQAQPNDVTTIRTIGVCHPSPNNNYSADNGIAPNAEVLFYFQQYEPQQMPDGPATITILQQPKHGILRLMTQADVGTILPSGGDPVDPADPGYFYLPENGYLGKDKAVVLVEIGGIKVKVVYFFQAIDGPLGNTGLERRCSKTGVMWKISTTLNPDGTNTLTSVEYQSPVASAAEQTAALASTLGLNFTTGMNAPGNPTADPSAITLNLADLEGGAVGQAVGTTITLDDNAAGHNWYIDTTPWDNSEYLPTSNPNEWVAKEGTDAYGKMDMLSEQWGQVLHYDISLTGATISGNTL